MRILLIGDDAAMDGLAKLNLGENFEAETTNISKQGVNLAALQDCDFILLDLNGSGASVFEVIRLLRASKLAVPFLALLDPGVSMNLLRGLRADECITKPFDREELLARIRARALPTELKGPLVVQVGDLTINRARRTVAVAGVRLYLTAKEYQVLELLSSRKGTVLTKEAIFSNLYLGFEGPGMKIIDVFVCNLRKKLAAVSNGWNYIETVWGRGYILREPDEEALPISA